LALSTNGLSILSCSNAGEFKGHIVKGHGTVLRDQVHPPDENPLCRSGVTGFGSITISWFSRKGLSSITDQQGSFGTDANGGWSTCEYPWITGHWIE
jgi:hypothetical protein